MSLQLVVPLQAGLHYLTYDQRVVWGRCPVCSAEPGERCHDRAPLSLGVSANSGVHLVRYSAAPTRVRIEALT